MRLPDRTAFSGPIARATLRTSFVLGMRLLVQAGTLLLVARMLGPHQFGAFAGVSALAVILGTLAAFGTPLVLLGEVSRDPARRQEVLCYAAPTTILFGSALLITYLLIASQMLANAGVEMPVLIAIGVTETLLQPLFSLPAAEHLALGRTARSQLLTTLPLALRLTAAATVFLLNLANPLAAYGVGYLLASLVALVIASLTMPAPWPSTKYWRLMSKTEFSNTAGYAALAITGSGPVELDKTLAARFLPLAAAGMYSAGARIIGAATLPVIAMMLSALPRLFRDGTDHPKRTARLLRWIFAAALGYSVALAMALWFMAPMFEELFGARYNGIQHTIHWLTIAVPGMALRITAGSVLMALGKPWMRVGYELVGLMILSVAAVLLIARFNATGMPIALACSEWTMAAIGGLLVWGNRQSKIGPLTGRD
ncbi:MAG: lipopolysaccharide biosynthesis protein [Rhodanobacter sp.]